MTYNPWDDLAKRYPGIHVEWTPLAPSRAAWVPQERMILIDASLSKAERRCALAHELAHIDAKDSATGLCWFAGRQETFADKLAARRLIDIDDLAQVARWTSVTSEAAEALDVTLDVLVLRCRTLWPAERGILNRTLALRELVA